MPIESTHPEYDRALPTWRKIRTTLAGEEAVKTAADNYVPKPRGFIDKPELWKEYVARGEWFPASARTVVGLLGAMFRRAPVVELPKRYEPWKSTITQNGLSIENFCKLCSKEEIEIGRFGILVDMPTPPGDSAPRKSRPYLAGYCAEQIINWAEDTVEDPEKPGLYLTLPTLVVLKECVQQATPGDRFKKVEVEQLRALYIDEAGFYAAEVWQKREDGGTKKIEWVRVDIVQPKGPNGKRLSFIPFIFVSPENQQSEVERSPIADLVSINWSHFNTALDLEWACHMTASPTVYVTGWDSKGKELAIGSGVAWTFPDENTKLDILEYRGDGIASLENRARVKEDKMAKLGANLLRAKNKQPETAETTRIEHSAESSILSMISRNSSAAITRALGWAVWWDSGLESDLKTVRVEQNTEFYDARLTSQELDSLTKAVQAGTIPVSVYAFNLIRGDMVKAGTTQEELEDEIQESLEAPRALGGSAGFGSSLNVNNTAGGSADPSHPDNTEDPAQDPAPTKARQAKKPAGGSGANKDKAPGSPGKE